MIWKASAVLVRHNGYSVHCPERILSFIGLWLATDLLYDRNHTKGIVNSN